ncbi:suppressor of fused domain protein [Pseudomonas sp. KNUC1026]|uniref:suppressor of fused domain protein n=1 Tax=Pseudomonas sp. KNUC1026 TaxID=2893890 RepID=UPI001F217302|nr:suppressor of fused domain protein [Pseudomonas sp. KNUC1026]UFH49515.1 suppressor of fused domain protein [Pseudomonas sp. KNUC1026]
MSFFRKLLGLSPKAAEQPAPSSSQGEHSPSSHNVSDAANQAAREAGAECLDRHWQSVGTVEPDVLAYLMSPSFSGGPHWPSTRQAYRVVRRGDSIILATEGLSDPFDDEEGQGNGFEMELFLETADIPEQARGTPGEVDPLKYSWAFELIEHVAGTVADAGGIVGQVEQYGALSLELPGVSQSRHMGEQIPPMFVSEDDSVGVLLGGPAPDFATRLDGMPLSPVTLIPVVLITAAELDYVRAGGRAAREDLVQRLQSAGVGHRSNLLRASVV